MKKIALLLSVTALLFFSCKPEPTIVLDQPYKISVDAGFIGIFTKGIIISNELGGVLFEKIFTSADNNRAQDFEILIDKSHTVINVTFVKEFLGSFRNETYFDVKNGAKFEQPLLFGSQYSNHTVVVKDLDASQEDLQIQVGNASPREIINTGSEISAEVFHSDEEEFFIFLWDIPNVNFRYLHIPNPDSLIEVSVNDFIPIESTHLITVTEDVNFFRDFSRITGTQNGRLKKIPVLAKASGQNNDKVGVFEIPGFEPDSYRLNLNFGNFSYKKDVDELPERISMTCDLTLSGSEPTDVTGMEFFQSKVFSNVADYFIHTRFFSVAQSSGFSNTWVVKGVFKQEYFVKLPALSIEMKQAAPSLSAFTTDIFEFVEYFQIEGWNRSEAEEFPAIGDEYFYQKGAFICTH